jgi:predicted dehydrogenase
MGAFIDNEVVGHASVALPYSHAAGYEANPRTDLIAGSDVRADVLDRFGDRYGIGASHRYLDYRNLLTNEKPDILSIATQPEQRARIILDAVEAGVRALYVEKPLCASLQEAYKIRDAVRASGVALNMGTNRRWQPGFRVLRSLIDSGAIGTLRSIVVYATGTLFNTTSHWFDITQYLSGDARPMWAHGWLPGSEHLVVGDVVTDEPNGSGAYGTDTGVVVNFLRTPRPNDIEVIGDRGAITAWGAGNAFSMRARLAEGGEWVDVPYPDYPRTSSTLHLIEDLVAAIDRGDTATAGGIDVAVTNTELIFGFIESFRAGGRQLDLPPTGSTARFHRSGFQARTPRFTAPA